MPPSRQLASRFTKLCLTAALVLVPIGAGAAAQVITGVVPPAGCLGSVLTISGAGFGSGRPTVVLTYGAEGHAHAAQFRLALQSFSDGEIHAKIDKALPGPCTLRVLSPGGGVASADFAVMPPQAFGVSPASAAPGAQVVIAAAFLGNKAVKVTFFDRRATIVALHGDSVTVIVPVGLPDGSWAASVSNPLGSDLADGAVAVSGGGVAMPEDSVRATIDGARFFAHGADVHASIIGPQIAFDATKSGLAIQQFSVQLPFSMASSPVPSVFSGPVSSQPIVFLSSSPANGSSSMWVAMPGLQPWTAAIVGRSGNHLAGTLSADLVRIAGAGPDILHVTDGRFVVSPHP